MTTGQVSEATGYSRSTIRRAVWAGLLRCSMTPGGHLRFDPDDVAAFAGHLRIDNREVSRVHIQEL